AFRRAPATGQRGSAADPAGIRDLMRGLFGWGVIVTWRARARASAALGAPKSAGQVPPALAPNPPEQPNRVIKKVTMDECVAIALTGSGQIMEAKGKVTEWTGRLQEVESVFFPKLMGLTFVAPLYRMNGTQFTPDVQRDFTSWGPYIKLQAILAQPIFTFGRYTAGHEAATERLQVEKARLEQAKNVLALEVRRYYLLHLYARSFKPALNLAKRLLDEAEKSAQDLYKEGGGKVTNVDLMKLRYGAMELEKYRVQADIGTELALAALKHTMGLPQDAAIEPTDEMLPEPPTAALPALSQVIAKAATHRPEVAQLFHGEIAAAAFEKSEKLSSMPTFFIAGQIDLNWTPMWPDASNPYAWDRFNDITPGAAVGLQFDVDIAKSYAKAKTAHGTVEQVEGLKKFASTGIPMEVRKAYDDHVQAERLLKLSDEATVSGRKWMIFAGSAFAAGTGEAKDLLEGMVAYLQGKKGYYDNLQALHLARATLLYVTGDTGLKQ
ncbi:MAG: TolC family protein, partial [Myxococcaceae bacterium]